jgi:hypothetical protein
MKKIFRSLPAIVFISLVFSACGNNDTQPKQKDSREIQSPLPGNTDSVTKAGPRQSTDSTDLLAIDKLVKHGMPILLTETKKILGDRVRIDTAKHELDFDNYTWGMNNGTILRFEDINYNEKGIELDRLHFTATNIIKHPLGIYLNKSTVGDCKAAFPDLKKSYEDRAYKFEKNKTWYFLVFNHDNILIEIRSSGWDTDMSS